MCFDQDADWYADLIRESRLVSTEDKSCCECGETIPAGEEYTHIYLQQYEECRACEWEDGPPCEDDEHDYGETFNYWRCDTCGKLLQAIKASELAEGCQEHESQPLLEELFEAFSYYPNSVRYADKVVEMFPELANHKWIVRAYEESIGVVE